MNRPIPPSVQKRSLAKYLTPLNAALAGWIGYIALTMLLIPSSVFFDGQSSIVKTLVMAGTVFSFICWILAIALGVVSILRNQELAKAFGGIAIAVASMVLFGFVFYTIMQLVA